MLTERVNTDVNAYEHAAKSTANEKPMSWSGSKIHSIGHRVLENRQDEVLRLKYEYCQPIRCEKDW